MHVWRLAGLHQDHSVTQHEDRVYVFSRQRVVCGQSQVAEYYMSSNNSWGAIQTNFEYNEQFSSLLVLNGEAEPEKTIFMYNPVKNKWGMVCSPLNRWGACGVTDGHHLYIMGGTNKEDKEINAIAKVEKFASSVFSREEIAAMSEARAAGWQALTCSIQIFYNFQTFKLS